MSKNKDMLEELQGKTGLDPDMEAELCRRLAMLEQGEETTPALTGLDWALIIAFIGLIGLLPVIVEAFRIGISA